MTLTIFEKTKRKEFLIEELQRFVRENERNPKMSDMKAKKGYPCYQTYVNYFGSWNNALITAGLKINETNEKRTGLETCCKCGCNREQTQDWITKNLPDGEVMCLKCYKNLNRNYMTGNLKKESNVGKATISQRIVANVLGLSLENDCNFAYGFNHPYDLYDEGRYNCINVKDSKLLHEVGHSPYWHFDLSQKETPDTYVMLAYDEDRKNILKVWITDAVDDLVYDERNERLKKSLGITNISNVLHQYQLWEVDAKPYNDMLHKMSKKRKDTDGIDCFLSNDDL